MSQVVESQPAVQLAGRGQLEPFLFVILGATGDLTHRKLLPALQRIVGRKAFGAASRILGVAVDSQLNDESFRARCCQELTASRALPPEEAARFCKERLFYFGMGRGDLADYRGLVKRIQELEQQNGLPGNRVFYLALPPDVFGPVITELGEVGLNTSAGWTRLVIEKPFGRDLESAKQLNDLAHRYFKEVQIYRIDHYLGKETVRNLLVFRFANSLFEPLWNRDRISRIEITVAETLGIEHRARYYETAGALRDMVQNHLTQLLTLAAMEVPAAFEAESIRHEKAKVLRSIAPIEPADAVLGQYERGFIDAREVPGYREEAGIAPASQTETFVALRLEIANWRWHGVPFYLRTGKRLPKRSSQIVVTFRCPPVSIFQPFDSMPIHPNRLVIIIQPDEGFDLQFEIKKPGEEVQIQSRSLHFRYAEAFKPLADAYETLLLDVVKGDATLFVRDDWVEGSWRIYTPVLSQRPRVLPYGSGTWGPVEARRILQGGDWTNP